MSSSARSCALSIMVLNEAIWRPRYVVSLRRINLNVSLAPVRERPIEAGRRRTWRTGGWQAGHEGESGRATPHIERDGHGVVDNLSTGRPLLRRERHVIRRSGSIA